MVENSKKAIGLLDSGVGGLTVAFEIFKFLPRENIVYFGDTLHLPYGPKSLSVVRTYVEKIINYLIEEKKVKAIIIACNTATSAALDYVKDKFEVPIFGMIKRAAFKAVTLTKKQKIAVIGTEGTIKSQVYQQAILSRNTEIEVYTRICPEFVTLVEAGIFKGPEVRKIADFYLKPLKNYGVDTLILACTHFPYLTPIIADLMGAKVKLVNPASELVAELQNTLSNLNLLNSQNDNFTQHQLLVSKKQKISTKFLQNGSSFLDLEALDFKEENIFIKQ